MEYSSSTSMAFPITNDYVESLLLDAEHRLNATVPGPQPELTGKPTISIPTICSAKPSYPLIRQESNIAKLYPGKLDINKAPGRPDSPKLTENLSHIKQQVKLRSTRNGWHDMPKANLTTELKRDLHLIRMRSVLDPKRHYKKDTGAIPQTVQIGTVLGGPTESFHNRIVKSNQKRTILEEAMQSERESGYLKSRYNNLQSTKMHGKSRRKESRYSKYASRKRI